MLQQQDKIFTNLYGQYSPELASAKMHGDWDNTKSLIAKGRDWIIEEIKSSGLRGR